MNRGENGALKQERKSHILWFFFWIYGSHDTYIFYFIIIKVLYIYLHISYSSTVIGIYRDKIFPTNITLYNCTNSLIVLVLESIF